jgi:Na+/H+ antiporter NhaC
MPSNKIALVLFLLSLIAGFYISGAIEPQWQEQQYVYQTYENQDGELSYKLNQTEFLVGPIVAYNDSPLRQKILDNKEKPALTQQWVKMENGHLSLLKPSFHYGFWSLLPAIIAISMCLLTKEPITALLAGTIVGAIILGRYDITDKVLLPSISSNGAATIVLLYLWLLGGLMGVWSKTGAAQAFANYMTSHYVRGPRSAKLVTWLLGVIFFQGGTISTVLVGTTVRPMADEAKVSHEEMSYIVDSTASPIASVLAFNAWPAYIQSLIFIPGVAFLATESDRLRFFFSSITFSFYGFIAVLGTLLLCFNITWHCGNRIKQARLRALHTGKLDADGSTPLEGGDLNTPDVAKNYTPRVYEFILPLLILIGIAITTFIVTGSPKVNWAFATALCLSCAIALAKGMSLDELMTGIGTGLKSVVMASVLLILAITVGGINKEIGGGLYLIELIGHQLPFWMLPVILQLLTMIIAFSTGTSWGTYAIAFPLAMPLAWAIGTSQGIDHPQIYMSICFAAVLNGSVYGDQCSPISDTTILSSMTTGCDLMDHVKSQLIPASFAALCAGILWTISAFYLA